MKTHMYNQTKVAKDEMFDVAVGLLRNDLLVIIQELRDKLVKFMSVSISFLFYSSFFLFLTDVLNKLNSEVVNQELHNLYVCFWEERIGQAKSNVIEYRAKLSDISNDIGAICSGIFIFLFLFIFYYFRNLFLFYLFVIYVDVGVTMTPRKFTQSPGFPNQSPSQGQGSSRSPVQPLTSPITSSSPIPKASPTPNLNQSQSPKIQTPPKLQTPPQPSFNQPPSNPNSNPNSNSNSNSITNSSNQNNPNLSQSPTPQALSNNVQNLQELNSNVNTSPLPNVNYNPNLNTSPIPTTNSNPTPTPKILNPILDSPLQTSNETEAEVFFFFFFLFSFFFSFMEVNKSIQ